MASRAVESAPPEQATTQALALKGRASSFAAKLPMPRQNRAHLGGRSCSFGSRGMVRAPPG